MWKPWRNRAGCGNIRTAVNPFTNISKTTPDAGAEAKPASEEDLKAAQAVAEKIDAIYVQQWTEETDQMCEEAKEAWDALTDEQKALVEGEFADPDYFGADTGDASKDDPLNGNDIGEKELLVVSFGTSFNDSRTGDIGGIEKALQEAYPDWSVRRAFTAQIIINHVQARDGERIDNVEQALERAAANGVKQLVVQPTHLMHGAEYDELAKAVEGFGDMSKKLSPKQSQRRQSQRQVMTASTRQGRTRQPLSYWDTGLLTRRRSHTTRCRHRWSSWDMETSSSGLSRESRKTPPVKQ